MGRPGQGRRERSQVPRQIPRDGAIRDPIQCTIRTQKDHSHDKTAIRTDISAQGGVERARLRARWPRGRCDRNARAACSSAWVRTVIGPLWFAAIAWTVIAAIAHALRQGFRHGDWSAFRGYEFPDDGDGFDWSTQSGAYAFMRIAEEHERLMREGDV